jgi:hypothetical protein
MGWNLYLLAPFAAGLSVLFQFCFQYLRGLNLNGICPSKIRLVQDVLYQVRLGFSKELPANFVGTIQRSTSNYNGTLVEASTYSQS